MTNREYLIKNTNPYDLLCRMNDNLNMILKEECVCIIECITGKDEPCYGSDCKKCIAEWLNEESEG